MHGGDHGIGRVNANNIRNLGVNSGKGIVGINPIGDRDDDDQNGCERKGRIVGECGAEPLGFIFEPLVERCGDQFPRRFFLSSISRLSPIYSAPQLVNRLQSFPPDMTGEHR